MYRRATAIDRVKARDSRRATCGHPGRCFIETGRDAKKCLGPSGVGHLATQHDGLTPCNDDRVAEDWHIQLLVEGCIDQDANAIIFSTGALVTIDSERIGHHDRVPNTGRRGLRVVAEKRVDSIGASIAGPSASASGPRALSGRRSNQSPSLRRARLPQVEGSSATHSSQRLVRPRLHRGQSPVSGCNGDFAVHATRDRRRNAPLPGSAPVVRLANSHVSLKAASSDFARKRGLADWN